jgi:hypothetical protein
MTFIKSNLWPYPSGRPSYLRVAIIPFSSHPIYNTLHSQHIFTEFSTHLPLKYNSLAKQNGRILDALSSFEGENGEKLRREILLTAY